MTQPKNYNSSSQSYIAIFFTQLLYILCTGLILSSVFLPFRSTLKNDLPHLEFAQTYLELDTFLIYFYYSELF